MADGLAGKTYGEDLAWIHDAGFGAFAREAAPGLLEIFRKNGVEDGLVVDLGCGNGNHTPEAGSPLWPRHVLETG